MENKLKEYTISGEPGEKDIKVIEKESIENLLKDYDKKFNFIASCIVLIYKDIETSNNNFKIIKEVLEGE